MKQFNAKCRIQTNYSCWKKDVVVLPLLNRSRTPLHMGQDVLRIKKSLASGKGKSPLKIKREVLENVIDTKEIVRNVIKKRLGSLNRQMYFKDSVNNNNINIYNKGNVSFNNTNCNCSGNTLSKGVGHRYRASKLNNHDSYVIKCSSANNGNEAVAKQKSITTCANDSCNYNNSIKHIQGKYLTLSKDNNSNNSRNSSASNHINAGALSNKSSTSSIQSKISRVVDYSDELESSESEDDDTYV